MVTEWGAGVVTLNYTLLLTSPVQKSMEVNIQMLLYKLG